MDSYSNCKAARVLLCQLLLSDKAHLAIFLLRRWDGRQQIGKLFLASRIEWRMWLLRPHICVGAYQTYAHRSSVHEEKFSIEWLQERGLLLGQAEHKHSAVCPGQAGSLRSQPVEVYSQRCHLFAQLCRFACTIPPQFFFLVWWIPTNLPTSFPDISGSVRHLIRAAIAPLLQPFTHMVLTSTMTIGYLLRQTEALLRPGPCLTLLCSWTLHSIWPTIDVFEWMSEWCEFVNFVTSFHSLVSHKVLSNFAFFKKWKRIQIAFVSRIS